MDLRKVWAVAVREFGSYFVSPIVYAFLAVFLFLVGYFNVGTIVRSQQAELNVYVILFIFMFLVPLLTMRLITREYAGRTLELMFTSPVRSAEFVLGKFLAVLAVYGVALLFLMEFPLFVMAVGDPDWMILLTQFLGLWLVGASFLALGLFCSCLTENQLIAAVSTFFVLLVLWVFSLLEGMLPTSLQPVVGALDLAPRLGNFQQGVLVLSDVVFFLSGTLLFLYAAVLYLNTRTWSR